MRGGSDGEVEAGSAVTEEAPRKEEEEEEPAALPQEPQQEEGEEGGEAKRIQAEAAALADVVHAEELRGPERARGAPGKIPHGLAVQWCNFLGAKAAREAYLALVPPDGEGGEQELSKQGAGYLAAREADMRKVTKIEASQFGACARLLPTSAGVVSSVISASL